MLEGLRKERGGGCAGCPTPPYVYTMLSLRQTTYSPPFEQCSPTVGLGVGISHLGAKRQLNLFIFIYLFIMM